ESLWSQTTVAPTGNVMLAGSIGCRLSLLVAPWLIVSVNSPPWAFASDWARPIVPIRRKIVAKVSNFIYVHFLDKKTDIYL
ncbi:MAG: hypothetical protein ACHQ1D_10305, partial [Nitrososphaerales archaeon]